MLIITLLTKRSSGQWWKLCIMYHIGSLPPPFLSVWLPFLLSSPPFVYYVYVYVCVFTITATAIEYVGGTWVQSK